MTIKEAIYQLKDIQKESESHIHGNEYDDVWTADVEALQIAIDILKEHVAKGGVNNAELV